MRVTGNIKNLGMYSADLKNAPGAPAPFETITQDNTGSLTNIEEIDVRYN
jgi:hypothetical protein